MVVAVSTCSSGMAGRDYLEGDGGSDRLEGGAGADTMVGGAGNDTYLVDDPGDQVIEVGSTTETIRFESSVSFSLVRHDSRRPHT